MKLITIANPRCLTALCLLFFAACERAPVTFEYRTDKVAETEFANDLNRFGAEGWELVSEIKAPGVDGQPHREVIMRRQKRR